MALTGLVSAASPAPAVFPGQNGPIAGGGCEPMNVRDCGLYLQTAARTRRILKTGKLFVKEAQWSPDGKRIAYVIGPPTGGELRVVNADGSGDRLVLKETGELFIGFSGTDWSWMRDGRHIVFVVGSSHLFLKIDANATNRYSSLTTPLRGMYATEVDASPVSDQLAVVYFNTEAQERGIALIALDDNGSNLGIREFKRVRTLPWDADDNYASLGWAPDGSRLAFVHSIVDKSINKGTARVEVVAALPDAPTPTPLTEYPKGTRDWAAYVEIARYSPDGKWISFKTVRDKTVTWEAITPDGTVRRPLPAKFGEIDWQPCFSNCETLSPEESQCDGLRNDGVLPGSQQKARRLYLSFPNQNAACRAIWAPEPKPGFAPQGLALVGGVALISGYYPVSEKVNRCLVVEVNLATGKSDRWKGIPECSHAGGIGRDNTGRYWIADTDALFPLEKDFLSRRGPVAGAKPIKLGNGLSGSFVVIGEPGTLWVGDWDDDAVYKFRIADLLFIGSSRAVTRKDALKTVAIADGGREKFGPQGAAFRDGKLWATLSRSTCGVLAVGTSNARWYGFGPGAEEIEFAKDGKLWAVFEAGAGEYAKNKQYFPVLAEFDTKKLLQLAQPPAGNC